MSTINGETPLNPAIVPLQGVQVSVGHAAGDANQRVILIGPILLAIPVNDPLKEAIVKGLTGISLAMPSDVQQ